ncbi:MAG TPA: hypothetical protein VGP99_03695 [Tepidisphaeraceae bacterium]|nr:hypothetical protein [Tepidisphaeraceae bacterium]
MLGTIVGRAALPIPNPPRNVRLRERARQRLLVMRVVSVLSMIFGAWMAWSVLKAPLAHAWGKEATARVEEVTPVAGDKLARWFDVKFSLETSGKARRIGYGRIDMAGDHAPLVGSGIAVKVLNWFPLRHAILQDDGGGVSTIIVGGLLLVFCLMAAVLSVLVWVAPGFQFRLLRDGRASAGSVVQKAFRRTFILKRHVIWYRYTPESGESWTGKAVVPADKYGRLDEGQPVSVIYQAGRPWRSMLYENADFEVV